MIRPATEADIPAIVGLARAFYPSTHYIDWCEMDDETVTDLTHNLLTNHVMIVAEVDGRIVGMVGLFVAPFLFNRNKIGGYEVVWFLAPEARGGHLAASLLSAIDQPCKERGCDRIQMVHMPNSPPQAAALYGRLGYVHSETSYTKEI